MTGDDENQQAMIPEFCGVDGVHSLLIRTGCNLGGGSEKPESRSY